MRKNEFLAYDRTDGCSHVLLGSIKIICNYRNICNSHLVTNINFEMEK